jgi:tetratricopeptide (TPR) repeat protein
MFLAGECSAVALHRDLGAPNADEHRFAGWHILRDLEGREADEAEGRRIAQRFIVARLVRNLLDDDLVTSPERLLEQVERTRAELTKGDDLDPDELRLWESALAAYGAVEIVTLANAMAELGRLAEERGHHHGAEEMYALSYGLAAAVSEVGVAAEAARAMGRVHRRQANRDTAALWYEGAREMATVVGLDATAARAISGLATLTRERGNLPAARTLLDEALELAGRSGDRSTVVSVHRDAVSLEQSAGNLEDALHHAWMAVGASGQGQERAQSLASLAGALERASDYDLASETWSVVAGTSDELYLQVLAFDAMAHICALRGDAAGFERRAAQCDALGYESVPSACAQILHYRGLSYRALERFDEAESWLTRAVEFADAHGFNETLFRAERDLLELPSYVAERVEATPAAPSWVREGVQAMRRELVGGAV